MPWRLLGFIFFVGIVLVFSVFNWKNQCSVSFGFVTLEEVPVYLTVFASFLLGLVCSLPYTISARIKAARARSLTGSAQGAAKKKRPAKTGEGEEGRIDPSDGSYGID
ncbi:MAG: hypothetical protein LBQ35_00400 [Spirochaetaceae bacterium]|jgi:uncharacterized integral membrane protein|nr:hypothetical protein [Spirochaetaceae bacterium]